MKGEGRKAQNQVAWDNLLQRNREDRKAQNQEARGNLSWEGKVTVADIVVVVVVMVTAGTWDRGYLNMGVKQGKRQDQMGNLEKEGG